MRAKPDWWDEMVGWVKRYCAPAEAAALDRLGEDAVLMRALAWQWRNTGAMGGHDGEKFVNAVFEAMRMAQSAEQEAKALREELAHLNSAAKALGEACNELRAAGAVGDLFLRKLEEVRKRVVREARYLEYVLSDPIYSMRTPHTVFAAALAGYCQADWLKGVVGDEIVRRTTEILFGVKITGETVRQLRRRQSRQSRQKR